MPAKHIKRIDKEKTYLHISNKGVSGKIIFADAKDCQVFLSYLQDYLTPPSHPDGHRRDFIIKGRRFQGVPHRPKNYFEKVYLIAYNLMPNHFHLLLYQSTPGCIEKFMRSLSTRYSMYFNRKHGCTGQLLEGPYKSIVINDVPSLVHLTRYFHLNHKAGDKPANTFSSYPEYIGKRETAWVKPGIVLSFFNGSENTIFKEIGGYKNFVEKFEPDQSVKDLLEGIILEKESEHLVGSSPQLVSSNPSVFTQQNRIYKPRSQFPEFSMAMAVFVLLFSLGFRNILDSSPDTATPNSVITTQTISLPSSSISPVVAGVNDESTRTMLKVKITNGQPGINIRQNPSVESEIIGVAKAGDIFEYVSLNSGWYEIKLENGSIGYISSKYVEVIKEESL